MIPPRRSVHRVRRRVFVPVGLAILGLLASGCFAIVWQKHHCVCERLESRLAVVTRMFKAELDRDAELMAGLSDFLELDSRLQQAFLARDREQLLEDALPRFESIRSKYRVTHLYFHDLQRVCFLRVHNPPRFGDTIDRRTLIGAAETGKATHGMELGPFGTLTIRMVHPWRIDGRLIGYVELGVGVEHTPAELKGILDADLLFAIDKTLLDRDAWQEGVRMTGQVGQWDLADHFLFIDRTSEDVPPQLIERLNAGHPEGTGWEFDFVEGSRTYRCGVVPLEEVDGHRVGHILSLLDITKSVVAQDRLLFLLVGSGIALAGALGIFFWSYFGWVQREVAHAQKEMEVTLQHEQSFADNVAHELRTPLAGIHSTIDVALYCDEDDAQFRESLQDCLSIVRNMEMLVDKLLMLSRLDGKKITFHNEPIDLGELVQDCWEPLQEKAAARGLTFEKRMPEGLTCISDRVGLVVIFSNLLENAVEYSNENGRIRVTAGRDSKGEIYAAVDNTGCQLEGPDVSMVFSQFWRGSGSRSGEGSHVGLGLPLARRLARALGGDLSAAVDDDGRFTARVEWGPPVSNEQ